MSELGIIVSLIIVLIIIAFLMVCHECHIDGKKKVKTFKKRFTTFLIRVKLLLLGR